MSTQVLHYAWFVCMSVCLLACLHVCLLSSYVCANVGECIVAHNLMLPTHLVHIVGRLVWEFLRLANPIRLADLTIEHSIRCNIG